MVQKPAAQKPAAQKPAAKKPAAKKPAAKKPAAKKPAPSSGSAYVNPAGFKVEALEVVPHASTGFVCLILQSNADRDVHRSELNICEDFSTQDPRLAYELNRWIYSLAGRGDGNVFTAHYGTLQYGPPDRLVPVAGPAEEVARLCPASAGAYVVGKNGYIGLHDGKKLVDLKSPSKAITFVSESREGTIYAAGGGEIYRKSGATWSSITLPGKANATRVHGLDATSAVFVGADGCCGRVDGTTVTLYKAPAKGHFHAVMAFRGRVFLGAGYRGLEVVDGTTVVPFKPNVFTFHLSASNAYLFASGRNEVARYDGDQWLATEFT